MHIKATLLVFLVFAFAVPGAVAQQPAGDSQPKAETTPELTGDELNGVQVAESVIFVYSFSRGRDGLDQIRKTWVEYGTIELKNQAQKTRKADYVLRILRGDSLDNAKIRMDQQFPDAEYALIYDGSKIFGLLANNVTKFEPEDDAAAAFSNRLFYGLEALLRFKENGSRVVFDREDRVMGVDYAVLKVTTKGQQEIFFYVSKKSLRVMMLEYELRDVVYRRKFYNYNYAQNTLFPYRTVLWADGKEIEVQETWTVTFGQEFGDEYFTVG